MLDLSIAPPLNISKIEVYRGGAPARAADPSPAGAIFLCTPKRPDRFFIKLNASAGSFGSYHGNVQFSQPFANAWYLASFDHNQSLGDFSYLNNNGTRTNPNDDVVEKRKNNDFTADNLLTKFGWNSGAFDFSIANTALFKRQGIPGLGTYQSTSARLNTNRDISVANFSYDNTAGTVFFDYIESEFSDPTGSIGLGVQNNNDFTYRFGEEISHSMDLGSRNRAFASISHRGEFYQPNNYASAASSRGTTSSRQQIGLLAEDTLTLFSERLSISPSLRLTTVFNHISGNDPSFTTGLDYMNERSDYQLTGKVGARVKVSNELYAKANFYRGFRNPSFSELFGDRGTLVGNPELRPEESINMDVGVAYEARAMGPVERLKAEASYFRNYSYDIIQYVQTSQYAAKPLNLSKALIQGVEASVALDYLKYFSASVSYTYQDAKDTSNLATGGKYLPGRPKNEVWLEAAVRNNLGQIYAEYNFMSGNFLDSQNLLEVSARHILNLGVSATPAKWVLLNFTIKNVTNDRTEDVIGFPLPGRSYWGAVTFNI
jgi:iron complex outermembrane receptor protein